MAEVVITWDNGAIDDVLVEPESLIRSHPEVVRRALLDLEPKRTSHMHLYRVEDPEEGSGLAEVSGLNRSELRRLNEMIQIIEVNRKIDMDEPYYMEELPIGMQGIAIRTPNPYMQLLIAGVFMGVGLMALSAASVKMSDESVLRFVILCLGIGIAVGAVWVFVRGWRRRTWWHAARAQVKRDGEKMPELLQIL